MSLSSSVNLKYQQACQGTPAKPRLPITPDILRSLKQLWDPELATRMWQCYGKPIHWVFSFFFCAVENWLLPFNSLLQISFNSLPWHSPWLSSFFINSSGETVELKLTELVRGWISWTATVLYPVSAILHYLAVCPANDLATLLSPPSYPMGWLMASPMASTSHCCLYVEW